MHIYIYLCVKTQLTCYCSRNVPNVGALTESLTVHASDATLKAPTEFAESLYRNMCPSCFATSSVPLYKYWIVVYLRNFCHSILTWI